ncbi:hypothetical protein Echvi_4048 [Echinicola vietnamensis DSM 17526]|uniref:Uncharacterized protein n=1 Tax=Echinicola vietnamensis (strain DSM 17526 / LMG 23754 / KMM 6221) TaxID=926556 RepID=L0G5Y8_ECHVK|nr:hypothetical protein Echvi_4048 [Echinicola vietnamensis DSM 17526]
MGSLSVSSVKDKKMKMVLFTRFISCNKTDHSISERPLKKAKNPRQFTGLNSLKKFPSF